MKPQSRRRYRLCEPYLYGYKRAPRIFPEVLKKILFPNQGQGVGEMGAEPCESLFFRIELVKLRRRREEGAGEGTVLGITNKNRW